MKSSLTSSEIVVGLDLGTTKVSAVVGEVDADGITILGVGNVPCRGLRKGVVSNIEWTVRSIREAIEAAQTMAGVEIKTVYAGVAGSHGKCHALLSGGPVAQEPHGIQRFTGAAGADGDREPREGPPLNR